MDYTVFVMKNKLLTQYEKHWQQVIKHLEALKELMAKEEFMRAIDEDAESEDPGCYYGDFGVLVRELPGAVGTD